MDNTDFDWFDEEAYGDWSDIDSMLADEQEKHDNAIYNQALEDVRDLMTYHQTGLTGYLTIMPDELDKLYK